MQTDQTSPNRRTAIQTAITTAAVAGLATQDSAQGAAQDDTLFVDTNVSLFRWPFRRLPLDDRAKLVGKLRELGIGRAWAGNFEAVLHRDLSAVNDRLAEVCTSYPELVPVGMVHLTLPGWENDFERCIGAHDMPIVRLYPGYHGYDLTDARFGDLLRRASKAERLVQITVSLEDTRTQHPNIRIDDVDVAPLADWLKKIPDVRVQLLGHRLRGAALERLASIDRVLLDTARVDGTDSIARLVDAVGPSRVMYGSHSPFLIPEAALIRVYESRLDDPTSLAVMKTTAESIVAAS